MHHILQYIFYYSKMFCALCKYDKKKQKQKQNKSKRTQKSPHDIHDQLIDPMLMYTHNPYTIYNTLC